ATEKGGAFALSQLLSTIDEPNLRRISDNTGGQFFMVGDKAQMAAAFEQIMTMSEQNRPFQMRLPFLVIGLVLLFAEWVLMNTRFKTLP
ncbi:MAG: hypothetical protein ABIA62_00205, partial [Candidatus Woesearchaeota archaeon]